jgi:hypothetical protein
MILSVGTTKGEGVALPLAIERDVGYLLFFSMSEQTVSTVSRATT